jgi:hypothetical protein
VTPLRWSNYYLDNNFEVFWQNRLKQEDASACVIIGVGFDPRSLTALKKLTVNSKQPIGCIGLKLLPPTELSESYQKLETLTQQNIDYLENLENIELLTLENISLRDPEGHLVGGRLATKIIHNLMGKIQHYKDVIIDISGLPRAVFYPLIAYLCAESDKGNIKNLHAAVTEDPTLDSKIQGGEYGSPDYIFPFRPRVPTGLKLVWLPVISSSESTRLEKIHNQIESVCAEICPILPFPAQNLRRADDILMQMQSILFERMLVSRNNLLLCDERTPFDIYRKIIEVDDYYRENLAKLPGLENITTVVSPLASKMLSLGMLLAVIERDLPVSYAEAGSYQINADPTELNDNQNLNPVEIWLTGEPYN